MTELFVEMLVVECESGLIAYFGGTEILDRAGEHVLGVDGPVVALGGKTLERSAVEAHERFLYHGLHLSVTALHVEHHRDGHTAGKPLHGGLGEVAEAGDVAGDACVDEARGVIAECVAVVGVEVGGSRAASFVAEEVVEGREFAVVAAFGLHLGETASDHLGEEFLGFDERHLYVAVGVAVERELACHAFGKRDECFGVGLREVGR